MAAATPQKKATKRTAAKKTAAKTTAKKSVAKKRPAKKKKTTRKKTSFSKSRLLVALALTLFLFFSLATLGYVIFFRRVVA